MRRQAGAKSTLGMFQNWVKDIPFVGRLLLVWSPGKAGMVCTSPAHPSSAYPTLICLLGDRPRPVPGSEPTPSARMVPGFI